MRIFASLCGYTKMGSHSTFFYLNCIFFCLIHAILMTYFNIKYVSLTSLLIGGYFMSSTVDNEHFF